MQIITSIVIQAILIALAFSTLTLRVYVRIKLERQALTWSDYSIWVGWLFAVSFTVCQCTALYILVDHPLDENWMSDSVTYLKLVYVSCLVFDMSLYFTKASIIVFYWWLVPKGFTRMRVALHISTAYLCGTCIGSILMFFLYARPISINWSLELQSGSLWNSFLTFCIDWGFDVSTDLMLFCIPFFIIKGLKIHRRQLHGLILVFSLGLITIAISLARFLVYAVDTFTIDDVIGDIWCTAELCTAVIVANLPRLKILVAGSRTRDKPSQGGSQASRKNEKASSRFNSDLEATANSDSIDAESPTHRKTSELEDSSGLDQRLSHQAHLKARDSMYS